MSYGQPVAVARAPFTGVPDLATVFVGSLRCTRPYARSRCDCSVAICFVTPSFRISLRSVPPGLLRRGSGVLGPLPKLDPLRASSTMSIGGVLSGGFSSEYPATPGSPPSSPRISFPRALAICCRHHSVGSDSGAAVHLPSYKDKELDNVTEL